jgi:nickel-dependent lactate racemase
VETIIKYGSCEERVNVPEKNVVAVAECPGQMETPLDGGDGLIREALKSPIGTPPLRDLVRGKKQVAVIVSDQTRPTPSRRLLPFVLEELEVGGVRREQVTVVVALGLHRPPTPEMLERMLGRELLGTLSVRLHDPDDKDNLVALGHTKRGTPVTVNRVVAEADIVVSFGVAEPHRMFGWSGGAKSILPGVSARDTVNSNHGRVTTWKNGIDMIEGNDVREDAEEAAQMAGLSFIVNCVLNREKGIVGVFAGHLVAAHRAAVALARSFNVFHLSQRVDIALISVGGPPRDLDFYQAHAKGVASTQHVLRDGGILVLATGCEQGIGAADFRDLLRGNMQEIEQWAREQAFSVAMNKAEDMVRFLKRARLFLVSPGLSLEDFPHLPVEFFPTTQMALTSALSELGSDATILVASNASGLVLSLAQ